MCPAVFSFLGLLGILVGSFLAWRRLWRENAELQAKFDALKATHSEIVDVLQQIEQGEN